MVSVAILCGGGNHAAAVYKQIARKHKTVVIWNDTKFLHPSLSYLPQFDPQTNYHVFSTCDILYCYIAVSSGSLRMKRLQTIHDIFKSYKTLSVIYPSLIHRTATMSPTAKIEEGCFIGPYATVSKNVHINRFCLISSATLIECDCVLESFVTLHTGAMLCGGARVLSLGAHGASSFISEGFQAELCPDLRSGAVIDNDVRERCQTSKQVVQPVLRKYDQKIKWCCSKPYSSERVLRYLQPSLEKGHLTNDGPLQIGLSVKLKKLVGSKKEILLTCNGTAALHALVAGLSLKEDRVLRWVTQAFTFPSSIQGPLSKSIVCDIDPILGGPCMVFLNKNISCFDGIIVTNVFGFQVDVKNYEEWCNNNRKLLVFDNAATPLGFLEDCRSIHDIGNGAIISLHETKPIGRGEGGAVISSRDVSLFVHQAMNFGYNVAKQIRMPNRTSSNWRMSDIAAAAICDHLDTIFIDNWKQKLRDLAQFATEVLAKKELSLAFPLTYPTILSCLFVQLKNKNGSLICQKLNSQGIEAKQYYTPLIPREQAPVAWNLLDSTICLPFHVDVTRDDIRRMIELLD